MLNIAKHNRIQLDFNTIKNTKAIAYTVAFHLVLLLVFYLVKYKSYSMSALGNAEFIQLETVGIALGVDNNGMGIEPPEMVMGDPAPPNTESSSEETRPDITENNSEEQESINTENENIAAVEHPHSAPVLKKANSPNPKPVQKSTAAPSTKQNKTEAAPAPKAKYSYAGSNGSGGNGADQNAAGSTNRGDGDSPGMKGKPGGDPNSLSFTGEVSGRSIVQRPGNNAEFRDGGRVAVKVWVNREGEIIRYVVQSAGNSTIKRIAEQKIKGIRFNKSATAPAEQNGIIYLNFRAGS
ncbi:MAG TPA: hypothetical protein PKX92_07540 [Edaphocola sp.]|nr:hypothetical protein [Edaphocola sp.]